MDYKFVRFTIMHNLAVRVGLGSFKPFPDSALSLTYNEDSDEIPHDVAFHQRHKLFAKTKPIFRERHTILFRNYNL